MNKSIYYFLEESVCVLSLSSSTLALEMGAFKKNHCLSFHYPLLTSFFALASPASNLLNTCSCSVCFPNKFLISKVFKLCDFFMVVTFDWHSLHIDLKTLFSQSWFYSYLDSLIY